MYHATAPTLQFLQSHLARMTHLFTLNDAALTQSGVLSVVSDFAPSRKARRAIVWHADLYNLTRDVEVALIGQWEPSLDGGPLGTVQLEINLSQTPKHVRSAQGMKVGYEHRFGGFPADHVMYRNVLEIIAHVAYQFIATGQMPHHVDFDAPVFVY